jgi:hypothetical protein
MLTLPPKKYRKMIKKKLEKYINASSDTEYFEQSISKLNDKQKSELEDLAIRLDNAGAKNPLQWAYSEVRENIPQFGRFLVLKRLFEIAKSPKKMILEHLERPRKGSPLPNVLSKEDTALASGIFQTIQAEEVVIRGTDYRNTIYRNKCKSYISKSQKESRRYTALYIAYVAPLLRNALIGKRN